MPFNNLYYMIFEFINKTTFSYIISAFWSLVFELWFKIFFISTCSQFMQFTVILGSCYCTCYGLFLFKNPLPLSPTSFYASWYYHVISWHIVFILTEVIRSLCMEYLYLLYFPFTSSSPLTSVSLAHFPITKDQSLCPFYPSFITSLYFASLWWKIPCDS